MCPRCNGLFVLGDEYSTRIVSGCKTLQFSRWVFSAAIFLKYSTHHVSDISRLRNPLITLNPETAVKLSLRYSPIVSPVFSGVFFEKRRRGNTISVKSPLKSFLVS